MDADQFDRVIRGLAEGFPRRRIGRILAAIATANGIGWSGSTRPRLGGAARDTAADGASSSDDGGGGTGSSAPDGTGARRAPLPIPATTRVSSVSAGSQ